MSERIAKSGGRRSSTGSRINEKNGMENERGAISKANHVWIRKKGDVKAWGVRSEVEETVCSRR